MQNFITLGQPLLGEKYVVRRKKRKIIPKIVDTSFRCNTQGQRRHFARTKIVVSLVASTGTHTLLGPKNGWSANYLVMKYLLGTTSLSYSFHSSQSYEQLKCWCLSLEIQPNLKMQSETVLRQLSAIVILLTAASCLGLERQPKLMLQLEAVCSFLSSWRQLSEVVALLTTDFSWCLDRHQATVGGSY